MTTGEKYWYSANGDHLTNNEGYNFIQSNQNHMEIVNDK
jgi:hypothetical protein